MKYVIGMVSLAIFSASCASKLPEGKRLNDVQQEHRKPSVQTATQVNDDQRQTINDGRPFVGMTVEEAGAALTLVSWMLKRDDKILKARFKDEANRHYTLFFDGGTPNRLTTWSTFTEEEIEEVTTFRDVRPLTPF